LATAGPEDAVKAAEAQPRMQADALAKIAADREEAAGIMSLLPPMAKLTKSMPRYTHEPPRPPYRLTSGD
jgi:hypothetical protein